MVRARYKTRSIMVSSISFAVDLLLYFVISCDNFSLIQFSVTDFIISKFDYETSGRIKVHFSLLFASTYASEVHQIHAAFSLYSQHIDSRSFGALPFLLQASSSSKRFLIH